MTQTVKGSGVTAYTGEWLRATEMEISAIYEPTWLRKDFTFYTFHGYHFSE